MIEYLSLERSAEVSGLSERTLRRGMHSPTRPLRHIKKGRRLLIRRDHLEEWLNADLVTTATVPEGMSPIVAELLAQVLGAPGAPRRGRATECAATTQSDRLTATTISAR